MYISEGDLKVLNPGPGTVVHVGAHHGQERPVYKSLGWTPIYWIEALPEALAVLKGHGDREPEFVIAAACSSVDGFEQPFYVLGSSGERSSLLPPSSSANPTDQSAVIVRTRTIDSLLKEGAIDQPAYLVLDVQGSEADVLLGARDSLVSALLVIVEWDLSESYARPNPEASVHRILRGSGYFPIGLAFSSSSLRWGDLCYVNTRVSKLRRTSIVQFMGRTLLRSAGQYGQHRLRAALLKVGRLRQLLPIVGQVSHGVAPRPLHIKGDPTDAKPAASDPSGCPAEGGSA